MTGALWAGDVGEETVEEIDLVVAGGNYGWSHCEGTLPAGCEQPGDVAPVFTYLHSGAGIVGSSVTGGAFPESGALAAWAGHYFFGDFGDGPGFGALYAVALDAPRTGFAAAPEAVVTNAGGPVDIVIGPDGALYYVAYIDGAVRRLVAEGGPPPGACTTIPACQAALDATLPDPATAADRKSRKTAKKLMRFDRTADTKLAKAETASGSRLAKLHRQARTALEKLLAAARTADAKGRLGVPLAQIEAAVTALLALVPAG
jgi:hypothetical protein